MSNEKIKELLGKESAKLVQNNMVVGLGTGSTAFFFIEHLIARCKEGLKIKVIASSEKSLNQAMRGGISSIDPSSVTALDLYVDGADEVDPKNRMIKGHGGALLREKILASSAKKVVIIVDESKLVPTLGKAHLPIEILPFAYKSTLKRIEDEGYSGNMRMENDHFYVTDNGNYIFDIDKPTMFQNPLDDDKKLINIPGVIETGFFFPVATDVLIGYANGKLEWRRG